MFVLDFYKPIPLEQIEAVLRRVAENHPKRPIIETKRKFLDSGYQGEKRLNYFLIPGKKYHIFHGLRLPIGNTFFQIDALLISPKITIIIESKNYAGSLKIEKDQLTQEINESKEVYDNPLAQAIRHKILLQYFLENYQLQLAPIEVLVVMTRSSSVIQVATGYHEASKKVLKVANLLKKIEELEKYYSIDRVDQKTIGKVRKLLFKKNTPLRIDVLRTYSIQRWEIITGVRCYKCFHMPMQFYRQKWICRHCKSESKDAYLEAINDHFLIFGVPITNKEIREYLHIPNGRQATYFLRLCNLPSTGTNKGRIYHQPKPKQCLFL
ncbi:nuclease-related domain-containing protein [Bacillus sp. FJAT-29814]|uniref:nuclease-related domain-containing protein n=1 Tax=Bacillus sp. FJAT-29814 TaxID=1729688 RepID=UPI00082EEE83|nr:nuclease-related domain-containing protein [Bacillus sp. FJAT-29814]